MQEAGERIEKPKHLAAQLAAWDSRIAQIAIINEIADDDTKLDLVCSFEPEPDDDATGYFWIANLLMRIDFEDLDERLAIPFAYDLSFRMGEQVFLPNGEILNKTKDRIVLWPSQEEVTITPERPRQRRPYEIFGLTDEEAARLRVTDERLKEILISPNTTPHNLKLSTNTFGEFLFLTVSRGVGQQRIYMTFYGCGYHKYRERWISDEWFWYQSQESTVDFSALISKEGAEKKLEERLEKIRPNLGEETQTKKGKKFEHFADLFDDDAALAGI
jgi:hypothetical protein